MLSNFLNSDPLPLLFRIFLKKYVIKQWLFEQMTEDDQDLLKEHNILVSFDDKYVAFDAFIDQTPSNR